MDMTMAHALDAKMRRGVAWLCLTFAMALALAPTAHAQPGGQGEGGGRRRDTMVVRLNATTVEQARLRARIESLIARYNVEQLTQETRGRLAATIDSLVNTFGTLARENAELRAGLATGMVEMAPTRAPSPRRRIDIGRSEMLGDDFVLKGWIGINVEGVQLPPRIRDGELFLRYLEYPKILTVDANSPAARAGILKGDVLVAYDGDDVRQKEINLTQLLRPQHQIRVTVDREGERRDYPVVVDRAPASLLARRMESGIIQFNDSTPAPRALSMARRGGYGAGGRATTTDPGARAGRLLPTPFPNGDTVTVAVPSATSRVFVFRTFGDALVGAQTAVVDQELGENFGVDAGVLLTHVADPSPARSSGLKSGDVIVRADGEDVTSVAQLRRIINAAGDERRVELRVVRSKRTIPITLRW